MPLPGIPPVPVQTPWNDKTSSSGITWQWLNFLKDVRDRALAKTPGPYADDTAAKGAGVAVGDQYYLPTGAVAVRLT